MLNHRVASAQGGVLGFLDGVGQNLLANVAASAFGAACVAIGVANKPDLDDATNWPVWLLVVGLVGLLLVGGNGVRIAVARLINRLRIPKTDGKRIAILIARLVGDANESYRESLRESVSGELPDGVSITTWPEVLDFAEGRSADAEERALKKAREWLKSNGSDLLIWGRANADGSLSLRFTSSEGIGSSQGYVLGPAMTLPPNFSSDLGAAIAARVATEIGRTVGLEDRVLLEMEALSAKLAALEQKAKDDQFKLNMVVDNAFLRVAIAANTDRTQELRDLLPQLRDLVEKLDRTDRNSRWNAVSFVLATALYSLGARLTEGGYLEECAEFCREVISQSDIHEKIKFNFRRILCDCLVTMGDREGDLAGLVEAQSLLEELLSPGSPSQAPWEQSVTRGTLGCALVVLGEKAGDSGKIDEGARLMSVVIREKLLPPIDMALLLGNYAKALRLKGVFSSGKELERSARTVETLVRREVPKMDGFAASRILTELGSIYLLLGERTGSGRMLRRAVRVLLKAEKLTDRDKLTTFWGGIQNTIGATYRLLAMTERKKMPVLQQAEQAQRNAIAAFAGEGNAYFRSLSKIQLGGVLLAMGVESDDPGQVSQSIIELEEALTVCSADIGAAGWAAAQGELGSAMMMRGITENSEADIESAIRAFGLSADRFVSCGMIYEGAMIRIKDHYARGILAASRDDPAGVAAAISEMDEPRLRLLEQSKTSAKWAVGLQKVLRDLEVSPPPASDPEAPPT